MSPQRPQDSPWTAQRQPQTAPTRAALDVFDVDYLDLDGFFLDGFDLDGFDQDGFDLDCFDSS